MLQGLDTRDVDKLLIKSLELTRQFTTKIGKNKSSESVEVRAVSGAEYGCTTESYYYNQVTRRSGSEVDQLANLHFHFTSVPRCTPMWRYNGTPMEILHLVPRQLHDVGKVIQVRNEEVFVYDSKLKTRGPLIL